MREVCEGGDVVIREVDCILILSRINYVNIPPKKKEKGRTNFGNTQILNRRYFVSYTTSQKRAQRADISMVFSRINFR